MHPGLGVALGLAAVYVVYEIAEGIKKTPIRPPGLPAPPAAGALHPATAAAAVQHGASVADHMAINVNATVPGHPDWIPGGLSEIFGSAAPPDGSQYVNAPHTDYGFGSYAASDDGDGSNFVGDAHPWDCLSY